MLWQLLELDVLEQYVLSGFKKKKSAHNIQSKVAENVLYKAVKGAVGKRDGVLRLWIDYRNSLVVWLDCLFWGKPNQLNLFEEIIVSQVQTTIMNWSDVAEVEDLSEPGVTHPMVLDLKLMNMR